MARCDAPHRTNKSFVKTRWLVWTADCLSHRTLRKASQELCKNRKIPLWQQFVQGMVLHSEAKDTDFFCEHAAASMQRVQWTLCCFSVQQLMNISLIIVLQLPIYCTPQAVNSTTVVTRIIVHFLCTPCGWQSISTQGHCEACAQLRGRRNLCELGFRLCTRYWRAHGDSSSSQEDYPCQHLLAFAGILWPDDILLSWFLIVKVVNPPSYKLPGNHQHELKSFYSL